MADLAVYTYLCLGSSEEERPGRSSEVETIHNSTDEDGLQVPGVGGWAGNHTVLGQSNHSTIIEHSQQHDQQCREVPAAKTQLFRRCEGNMVAR